MFAIAALLLLALTARTQAATIVLDFEEEALGTYEPGFVSTECGCVRLSEDPGDFGELRIVSSAGGRAVVVGEEGGALLLEFLVPVLAVSIDFGNDSSDPNVVASNAQLRGFADGVQVASDEEAPNRNSLADQTLSITSAVAMDRALFVFVQSGEFEPLSPLVDNLVLTTVPEPGTLGFAAIATLTTAGRLRRARASMSRRAEPTAG